MSRHHDAGVLIVLRPAHGLDDSVFHRLLGPRYVAVALHLARAADPAAKLFANENGINGIKVPGSRQDHFDTLVQELLATGAPQRCRRAAA